MDNAQFTEVGRVKVSDTTDIVVSRVTENGELMGLSINKWVATKRFTGFVRGAMVPKDKVGELVKLLQKGGE